MRSALGPALSSIALAALIASFLGSAVPASAADDYIEVVFDFEPSKASYAPNESFEILFTVRNILLNVTEPPNLIKIANLSAYFSWMGPSERIVQPVSGAQWLYPGEAAQCSLNLTVPANASEKTYSYLLVVEYNWMWTYGTVTLTWTSQTYRDFVVEKQSISGPTERVDYLPFAVAAVVVVAIGAVGAVLYSRRSKSPQVTSIIANREEPATLTRSASVTYPNIHAVPGEQFPIERGSIYLVKEKRPNISFAIFNEAVNHGAKGMLVVREHPNRLNQMHSFEAAKILWLTRRVGVDHIDPTELSLLSLEITKFVEGAPRSVVLIEGVEYMITQNDFESVLRLVNHLHDFVLARDSAVIVTIDPRVLSTRELALLERSAKIVEPAEGGEQRPERQTGELEV